MSSNRFARREFITYAAKTLGAAGLSAPLTDSVLGSILNQAMAQTAPEKFYIHLSFPGGPPRWLLDLPTNPSQRAADFIAGGFGTGIQGGAGVAQTEFTSTAFSSGGVTYHLPPVWGMGSAANPYTGLLANTVMFRGMDMEINSHQLNNTRNVAPVLGGTSITGSLADRSKLPFPGITNNGYGAGASFSAKSGSSAVPVNSSLANPLAALLQPFKSDPSTSPIAGADWERAINQSLREFESYSKTIGLRPTALGQAYDSAIELIKKNAFNLSNSWDATKARYTAGVDEAFSRDRIAQIFPQVIRADGSEAFSIDRDRSLTAPDLRDMFVSGCGSDFAGGFALAELLIREKLTSNLTIAALSPEDYRLAGAPFRIHHDQHNVGAVVSVLSTTAFYRALLNSINTLVTSLKQSGQFNQSVIHVGAEFSRSPLIDKSGSDHGVTGSSAMLISGMIPEYGLMGNIFRDGREPGSNSNYVGTWGRAAPIQKATGVSAPIHVQDIANTVTSLLGVEAVSANGYRLLNPNGTVLRRESNNV